MKPKYSTEHRFGNKKSAKRKLLVEAARKRWQTNRPKSPEPVEPRNAVNNRDTDNLNVLAPTAGFIGRKDPQQKPSASQAKLFLFKKSTSDSTTSESLEDSDIEMSSCENLNIINFGQLQKFVSTFSCPMCSSKSLTCQILNNRHEGIVEYICATCSTCGEEGEAIPISPRIVNMEGKGKGDFLLNKRIVSSFVSNGLSFSTLDHFCGAMNMHSMTHKTFDHHATSFKAASMLQMSTIEKESAIHVRNAYKELNPNQEIDEHSILDICVSFDGSWRKRGHTSHHGIVIVIDVVTGLALDYEVLSTFCPTCDSLLKRKDLTPEQKIEIKERHNESGECQKNFDGSANAMEAEAAVRIWSRSLTKHQFRYTEILADGDAKTYSRLLQLDPYPGIEIKKDECINHIKKRMGTALRKLVADEKAKGIALGGRGKGTLTNVIIDRLANYYGKAIRENIGDLEAMRTAVFATFFHTFSTDEEPYHNRCPHGVESWCFYNAALAQGNNPPSHEEHLGTVLAKNVAEKVKEVYQRLGDPNLLQRCMKGKTQNSNESLHSKIWSYCPKITFSGRRLIDAGVAHAIAEYNAGATTLSATFKILNIPAGKLSDTHSENRDKRRIQKSERVAAENTKEKRKIQRRLRATTQDNLDRQEGHLYETGGGD